MGFLLQNRWGRSLAHAVLAAVIALMVLGSFMRVGWNSYDRAMLRDMVYSEAHRPFVYRVLSPLLIRRVMTLIPEVGKQRLRHWAAQEKPRKLLRKWDLEPEIIVEATAVCVVLGVSLLVFCYSMGFLLNSVFIVSDGFVKIASLGVLLGLPPFFRYYSYIYDFPTLALFTLSLALMVRRWWLAYMLAFLLACLSKETAILLLLVYCLHFWERLPAFGFWGIALFQAAVFAAVKVGLTLYFADQPGGFVETHVLHNVLLEPYTFGQFAAFILAAVAVAHDWSRKPVFLRRALWILPVLVVLTFFLGLVDEYRDYYEAYPIVVGLILPSIAKLVGVRMTPAEG